MAQQIARLALNNADFPLLSSLSGRPVLIQNQDAAVPSQQRFQDFKPKPIYMHNVLPVKDGLKSVAYAQRIAAAAPAVTTFDEVWNVTDSTGAFGLFSPAAGANFLSPAGGAWVTNPVVPVPGFGASHAIVGGQSYICWGMLDVYTLDCVTGVLTSAALIGIDPTLDISGITSANNYLIAWNPTTVFWSNPANPSDFTPSLTTGAGSGTPTELRGQIIAVHTYLNGFIIYSTENIIIAQYSGNAQFPWIFKDIAGAQAIVDAENVTHAAVDVYNIALTASGFIRFSSQGSEPVFPEVSDFLGAMHFEDFNAGVFTQTPLAAALSSRITRVGSRYVVISYGVTAGTFTHALVYDTSLQRWGKLKVTHNYCFAYTQQLVTNPMTQIGFLLNTGAVQTIDMSLASDVADAVIVIGGISMTRGTWLMLDSVELNGGKNLTFTVTDYPSSDGINLGTGVAIPAASEGYYPCRIAALNHNVAIAGSFMLSTFQSVSHQYGVR